MAERFYLNFPLCPGLAELDGPEAHHLATVCRFRPGDVVCLFNGDGRQYSAEIIEVGRKRVQLNVVRVETPLRELGHRLEMAAPLPKGDRAQFLVEKLTELGVTAFTPLRTARSVVEPREAKLEKLQRHAIEACKQCGRNVVPEIRPLVDWRDFVALPSTLQRWLADPQGNRSVGELSNSTNVIVAVGPEGGLTGEEVSLARDAGWQLISLGPRILRVETAAIALAAILAVH